MADEENVARKKLQLLLDDESRKLYLYLFFIFFCVSLRK